MNSGLLAWLLPVFVAGAYLYLSLFWGWALLHFLYAERWWWLFLLNTFAVYLFLPLPLTLLVAWWSQQGALQVAAGAALLWALYLYGGLFWLKPAYAQTPQPMLTVMTFNALAYRDDVTSALTAMQTANADVVALQELNPAIAAAIAAQLTELYPYQVLQPHTGSRGMGVLSRYPLQPTGQTIAGDWLGPPQVLRLEFQQSTALVINCHAISIAFNDEQLHTLRQANASVPAREKQMQALADFVAAQPLPAIALGDFNTSDQTRAYRLVTRTLRDSWREGGYGLGHTFPGADAPGSSRPVFLGLPVPMWLVRIDYIFHTAHWRTVSARIGPWDGISDHRPVMAQLRLQPKR